ncbi:MAG: zinc ribbon domain-containing protein [Tepidisphaeraceae bacterium]
MPSVRDDEADDDDFDPEGPDPDEMDSSDDPDLAVCPHCRKMISEDAERCPHCGEYISLEDTPASAPMWIVAAAIVALLIVLFAWIL